VALVETERFVAEPQEATPPKRHLQRLAPSKAKPRPNAGTSSPASRPTPRRSWRPPAGTGRLRMGCTGCSMWPLRRTTARCEPRTRRRT
jgi:hypothetical protein